MAEFAVGMDMRLVQADCLFRCTATDLFFCLREGTMVDKYKTIRKVVPGRGKDFAVGMDIESDSGGGEQKQVSYVKHEHMLAAQPGLIWSSGRPAGSSINTIMRVDCLRACHSGPLTHATRPSKAPSSGETRPQPTALGIPGQTTPSGVSYCWARIRASSN